MFHNVNGPYGPKRVGLTRMRLMSQKELRLHFRCLGCPPNLVCWERKLVGPYIDVYCTRTVVSICSCPATLEVGKENNRVFPLSRFHRLPRVPVEIFVI